MVTAMVCWLVIHTSNDGTDNRRYEQFTGVVLDASYDEKNQLNFAADFAKKHVDVGINDPIRWVKDNECLYVQ
jgi:hypothetical protein